MKLFLQVVDRLGEWIILTMLFTLTSTLTLLVGVGASYLALVRTCLRLADDDQGYLVRNYWRHFKNYFKPKMIVKTLMVYLLLTVNFILGAFLLSLPMQFLAVLCIFGQTLGLVYGLMFISLYALQLPRQSRALDWSDWWLLPIKNIGFAVLIVCTWLGFLLPIYVSFAFAFVILPMIIDSQIWLGKKVHFHA